MSLNLYHPNSKSLGSACRFNYDSKNNTVFAEIIKQSSWDDTTRIGSFKENVQNPDNKISIKLGDVEIGGILDCIDNGRDFSTYHITKQSDEQMEKSINFKKWYSKTEPTKQSGYSFNITLSDKTDKTRNISFYIGLKFSESRLLKEYLIWALNQIFQKNTQDFQSNK